MTGYQEIFSQATGITDPKKLDRIEEIVRCEYRTLGHLTRAKLVKEAKIAVAVMKHMGEL